ncbi:hypothetical protein SEA_RASPUTIA_46 [Microbacterium phage Rasputia]|nr:hypothetical protein SEA_RASPUTIA_46 [Microbacterium phage Rasputia]
MTATLEEALEQGWHQPTPTFFGKNQDDVMVHAGKCRDSAWVLMRRTEPSPVIDTDHPAVVQALDYYKTVERIPTVLAGYLPSFLPRPRPVTYAFFPEYRR